MAKYDIVHYACMVVLLCMVVISPHAEAAITCNQVRNSLKPCLGYIMGGGNGSVPGGCCRGIKALNSLAKTAANRRAACQCIKSATQKFPGSKNIIDKAAKIPAKCGVHLPFKTSSSINCSRLP